MTLFDVYRGAPLAADEKSLAWRLEMRAGERPLGEGEVEELVARLVEAVAAAPRGSSARLTAAPGAGGASRTGAAARHLRLRRW